MRSIMTSVQLLSKLEGRKLSVLGRKSRANFQATWQDMFRDFQTHITSAF